jgi:hypothetical protein
MNNESKKPSKVTPVISGTRAWSSGNIKFTVLTVEGHPEKNYITLQKHLVGRKGSTGLQQFLMNVRDWTNLKQLVEVELPGKHQWVLENSGITVLHGSKTEELAKLVQDNPEMIDRILEAPNLKSLSATSFEHLNSLAMKVFKVQSKNLDLVLKNLAKASPEEFVQFASLLTDLRLGQVATLANLVKQKLEIIGLFEKLTAEETTREKEIHRLIEQNPWIADNSYEIVASDKQLADFLAQNVKEDPELKTRPDLIAKRVPHQEQIILIELKRPSVKLKSAHIGQILGYRDLIMQYRPGTKSIHCFLFGYQKQYSSLNSNDVTIRTFSELASSLRDEYSAYLKVLEENSEDGESLEDVDTGPEISDEDIPF